MPKSAAEFQLITLPESAEQSEFENFVNDKLAFCLKNGFDNVILNFIELQSFQKSHLTIITRWLRNLQSLGGILVLTGVNGDMLKLFRSAKVTAMCDIYSTLKQFKHTMPQSKINDITDMEDEVEDSDQLDHEPDIDESAPVEEPESIEHPPLSPKDEDSATAEPEEDFEKVGDMEEGTWDDHGSESTENEGSITESINIQKLAQMGSAGDVSEKLSFLKGNPPKVSDSGSDDLEEEVKEEEKVESSHISKSSENQEQDLEDSQSQTDAPPQIKEEIGSEADYVLSGSDEVPSSEEINEIFKDFEDEAPEKDNSQPASFNEDEEIPTENSSPQHEKEKFDYSKTKTGLVNEIVEMSGEYECLTCKVPEYFLKGSHYEKCRNPDCSDQEQGWEPVLILF